MTRAAKARKLVDDFDRLMERVKAEEAKEARAKEEGMAMINSGKYREFAVQVFPSLADEIMCISSEAIKYLQVCKQINFALKMDLFVDHNCNFTLDHDCEMMEKATKKCESAICDMRRPVFLNFLRFNKRKVGIHDSGILKMIWVHSMCFW